MYNWSTIIVFDMVIIPKENGNEKEEQYEEKDNGRSFNGKYDSFL